MHFGIVRSSCASFGRRRPIRRLALREARESGREAVLILLSRADSTARFRQAVQSILLVAFDIGNIRAAVQSGLRTLGRPTATAALLTGADIGAKRSEWRLRADSVEKQRVAGAECGALNMARAPFLSGCLRFLRCGKDLSQFPEVLGGGGEEKFVVCATWPT